MTQVHVFGSSGSHQEDIKTSCTSSYSPHKSSYRDFVCIEVQTIFQSLSKNSKHETFKYTKVFLVSNEKNNYNNKPMCARMVYVIPKPTSTKLSIFIQSSCEKTHQAEESKP